MYGGGFGGPGGGGGLGMGGGRFRRISGVDDEKPKITWPLLRRVLAYARPYRVQIAATLVIILASTALGLLTPLFMRILIDKTLPSRDLPQLLWLTLGLLLIPVATAALTIW